MPTLYLLIYKLRYYSLFIASNVMGAIFYFFCLPETKGKSLEEIGEIFGDTLATANLGDINVAAKQNVTEIEHAENSDGTNRDQIV